MTTSKNLSEIMKTEKLVLKAEIIEMSLAKKSYSNTGFDSDEAVAKIQVGKEIFDVNVIKDYFYIYFYSNNKSENETIGEYKIRFKNEKLADMKFNQYGYYISITDVDSLITAEMEKDEDKIGQEKIYHYMLKCDELSVSMNAVKNTLGDSVEYDFSEIVDRFKNLAEENDKAEHELMKQKSIDGYNNHYFVKNVSKIQELINNKNILVNLTPSSIDEMLENPTREIRIEFNFIFKKSGKEFINNEYELELANIYSSSYRTTVSHVAIRLKKRYDRVADYQKLESLAKKINSYYEDFVSECESKLKVIKANNNSKEWFENNFKYRVEVIKEKNWSGNGKNSYSYETSSYYIVHESEIRKIKNTWNNKIEEKQFGYKIKFWFDGCDYSTPKVNDKTMFSILKVISNFSNLDNAQIFLNEIGKTGKLTKFGHSISIYDFTAEQMNYLFDKLIELSEPTEL